MEEKYSDLLCAIEREISSQFIFSIVLSAILGLCLIGIIFFSKNKKDTIWLIIVVSIVFTIAIAYSVWISTTKSNIKEDIDQDCIISYTGEFSFSKASQSNPEYHSIKIIESDGSTIMLRLYHNDKLKNEFPVLGEYMCLSNGNYYGTLLYAPNSKIILVIENLSLIK